MSFIEVRDTDGEKVTVNTDHIVTFAAESMTVTDIQLNPGSAHGAARLLARVSYDHMRKLLGLDWLRCGETYNGEICDRRLDEDSRCPIHGRVGE